MTVRGYTLAIDWAGSGQYNGTYDDVTSRVQKGEIVIAMGRDSAAQSGQLTAGELGAELNNHDRVLSPEYTSGPLYGRILPGRRIKFTATAGTTIYTLFESVLDSLDVSSDSARTFSARALDAWGKPGAEKLSTGLYQGIRTSDAITIILDAIGWTGGREIDTGSTVMPYWWAEGDDAASAVQKLVNAEGPPAVAYVRGGTFVFRGRHHRLFRTKSLTSQALFTHIEPAGTGPGNDLKIDKDTFVYDHGLSEIANSVTFSVDTRVLQSETEVWNSDEQISLVSGETRTIDVSSSDPFTGGRVVYDLQSGTVSVGLSRTDGAAAVITVTATSAAVITRLAVIAQAAPAVRTNRITAEDAVSMGTYTRAAWDGDDPDYANRYDAQAIADHIVSVYGSNQPRITFSVTAPFYDATKMAALLGLDVSDRITVRNDRHNINTDFIVERIVHRIRNLTLHTVEIGAQVVDPVQSASAFTFGVAGRGFNDGTFATVGIDNPSTVFRFDVGGVGFNQGVFGT